LSTERQVAFIDEELAESLHINTDQLGCLTWYSIFDMAPTLEDIQHALDAAGLGKEHAPNKIFPADAFRRATSLVEQNRIPVEGEDDRFVNILVREVARSSDTIVREVVDAKNVRLSYTEVAALILDRRSTSVTVQPISYGPRSEAEDEALERALELYQHALTHYDSRAVRQIVHGILLTTKPVAVRPSGGVYFVRRDDRPTVKALATFVDVLGNRNGSKVWSVPLYDEEENKDMLADSLQAQVEEEGRRIVEEVRKTLAQQGEVPQHVFVAAVEETKRLALLTDAYEEMLAERVDRAKAALELAQRALKELWDKV
jgi:hypothetical protein